MRFDIALCADETFSMPCGICITSIFESNANHDIHIYILTEGFSKRTLLRFRELAEIYRQSIQIIKLDNSKFIGLKSNTTFPISIYYRYLIPNLINVPKVLYLDSDIVVTKDLSELYESDIRDVALAVVEDQKSDDIQIHNRLGIKGHYFNSGVLLINCYFWKSNNLLEKLVDFIEKNPEVCLYPDQDALNVILEDKVLFVNQKYNVQTFHYLPFIEQQLRREKWPEVECARTNPTIIHFTYEKPWYTHCHHPKVDSFLNIYRRSLWRSTPLLHKYSIPQRAALLIIICLKKVFKLD